MYQSDLCPIPQVRGTSQYDPGHRSHCLTFINMLAPLHWLKERNVNVGVATTAFQFLTVYDFTPVLPPSLCVIQHDKRFCSVARRFVLKPLWKVQFDIHSYFCFCEKNVKSFFQKLPLIQQSFPTGAPEERTEQWPRCHSSRTPPTVITLPQDHRGRVITSFSACVLHLTLLGTHIHTHTLTYGHGLHKPSPEPPHVHRIPCC